MRRFINAIAWFAGPIIIICLLGLYLPTTPRASKSLLFASLQKDSLLQNTEQPRIIFVGGSNLPFGLNSQMIKDELNINPINTGIAAGLGLIYMMNNTLQYLQEGDIIILVPEYHQFYNEVAYGDKELLRTIFDVNISKIRLLNCKQLFSMISFIPKYSFSKLNPGEYINVKESDIYGVDSFNQFGDTYTHWGMKRHEFTPYSRISGKFDHSVIQAIIQFQSKIENKNAVLFISYPGYQDKAFNYSIKEIKIIEKEYKKNGFKILGFPERYMIPDSMMFNTSYHLSKRGVDYRTNLFIEDFLEATKTSTP